MSDDPYQVLLEANRKLQEENRKLQEENRKCQGPLALSGKQRKRMKPVVVNMKGRAFPNQKTAQSEILGMFMRDINYVLLRADVQSGKTGVYQLLIQVMFQIGMIDQAYIVCGSNEIELRNQCMKDVKEWHGSKSYFTQKNEISVIFRQDFKKHRMNTSRTLIIVDETHLVAGSEQTMSKFFEKHGFTMAGKTPSMIREHTYILSVDATPFAEESAMAHKNSLPKGRVILQNSYGYFGPHHYYENGLVQATWTLSTAEGYDRFKRLLMTQKKKFVLIRVQEMKNKEYLQIVKCIREAGCNIARFDSKHDGIDAQLALTKEEADEYTQQYRRIIPCLEVEPVQTTVVFIDGRLRCGKRVSKEFIGFVWESSNNANTDTIIQSLFGRMCGYDVGENKPLIFIPKRILDHPTQNKVVQYSDLERYIYSKEIEEAEDGSVIILPRFASHLKPSYIQNKAIRNGVVVTQCVPIRLFLNQAELENAKFHCLEKLQDNKRLITDNHNFTEEQKEEINTWLETCTVDSCHHRKYEDVSNQNMHRRHVEAYRNNTASKEPISDSNFLTFCITYSGFQPMDGIPSKTGEVFAIFYTNSVGFQRNIEMESRIAHHDGKSQFSVRSLPNLVDCPAGSLFGFSPKIRTSSEDFYNEFSYFIQCAKSGVGLFGRRFTALHNGENILLPREVYGDRLENMKHVFERLSEEHNIIIEFKVKKVPMVAGSQVILPDHSLKFIEWKDK
jgi:hypothetical protein